MRKRLPLIAALAGVVAIAVVATLLVTGGGDDGDTKAEPLAPALKGGKRLEADKAFRLNYPKTWERVSNADLGVKAGTPLAAIRRTDGAAQMIVQRAGKLAETLPQVSDGLTKRLKKQIKDFRLVKTASVKIPAGEALSYTFVRTKTGQVQNLTVVPQGKRTYTLNSVVSGKAEGAAREVAAIVRSFDPEG
jgi:hypothetical protein